MSGHHEIHRLESYQSGGSSVGGVEAKRETTKGGPSLHAQFSLIGESSDDGSEGGETFERSARHWCIVAHPKLVLSFAFVCILIAASSLSLFRKVSQENSSEQKACTIQTSYGAVSQDVMKLENTSSIENKRHGAVATDHEICSKMGVSVLKDLGGNAADAAVTAALCLGVVNPSSSGLGGGAFILLHSDAPTLGGSVAAPPFEDARSDETKMKERRRIAVEADVITKEHPPSQRGKVTEVIDCRETAPLNATYDMYESIPPESSTLGGLSIAVPGELRGLELLHYRHGSLTWSEVVRPAMELARDGFRVSTYLAQLIEEKKEYFGTMPDLAYILTKDNDGVTPLKEGDIMKREQLAKTLESIMEKGAEVLYKGDLAKMLAMDIQLQGGIITASDLSNYRPVLVR
jgi:gamma-glutamyltranspeptidase